MKVFISWSGPLSKQIAIELRWWVRKVNQDIEPYMSEEGIESGQRWAESIAKELGTSNIGIICVTKGNINRPWLNFESGALSKSIDSARVIPFLYNLRPADLIKSPLQQFQARAFSREDLTNIAETLNKQCERKLENTELHENLHPWWDRLETELNQLDTSTDIPPDNVEPAHQVGDQEILEELLEIARNQERHRQLDETDFIDKYWDTAIKRGDAILVSGVQLKYFLAQVNKILPGMIVTVAQQRGKSDVLWTELSRLYGALRAVSEYANTPVEFDEPMAIRDRVAPTDERSSSFGDVPF